MKQSSTPRLRILCRSITEQPDYTFSMLYNEVHKNDIVKTTQSSKKTLLTNSSAISNVRYYPTLSQSRKYIPKIDPQSFNISKKIKEIQRITKSKKLDPLETESRIAFAKDKIDIVFESTKLLKQLQARKHNSLNDEVEPISTFVTESKEISVNNVLIKLLKEESDKLETKEQNATKALQDEQDNFNRDQSNFIEYSETQKKACKEIEQVLQDIQRRNKELLYTEKAYRAESKQIEEEMAKILEQIDNGRVCAKFVNHVLSGDVSKYGKEILPEFPDKKRHSSRYDDDDNDNGDKKINFGEITQKVIKEYDFVLNDNNKESDALLHDPMLMILRFKEFEDRILRLLMERSKLEEELQIVEQEHNATFKELKRREENHLLEFDKLQEDCYKLLKEWEKVNNNQEIRNKEYHELVKELHRTLIEEDVNYVKPVHHVKSQVLKKKTIVDLALESVEKITDLEGVLNDYITQMELYMNQDKQLFMQTIIARKNRNKEYKQSIAKLKLEEEINIKRIKAQERMRRIIIQSRKTEPPFRFVKKKKKVMVNENELQQERDKEMLEY